MNPIDPVNNKAHIIEAEFVRIDVLKSDNTTEVLTFSSAYKTEVINGEEYDALGGLMAIEAINRDLIVGGSDLQLSITGIDGENIFTFMSDDYKILGSKLTVHRGFYDQNYILTDRSLRFTGIISSYNINQDIDIEGVEDNHTIVLTCDSLRSVLESRISGVFTNSNSWRAIYPNDPSMDRVTILEGRSFDFGKPAPPTPSGAFGRIFARIKEEMRPGGELDKKKAELTTKIRLAGFKGI
jgi:hypothetical protein